MKEEKTWSVYMHINKTNKKKYIGITSKEPIERWGTNGCKYKSGVIAQAIRKYGWNNFDHIVLCTGKTEQEAKEIEQYLIRVCETKIPKGYNMTDGGDGTVGYKMPSESLRHRSESIRKLWDDPEYKEKMTAKRHEKSSVYQSREFKEKISSLVTGKKNPNYGNRWTDEQKNALRKKQMQNDLYDGHTNPNAKKIRCIETGEVFDCIEYARQKYGLKSTSSYIIAAKNPSRTAAGFHWEYVN